MKVDRQSRVVLMRQLLREARAEYAVFSRMLQGPSAADALHERDLSGMIQILDRWLAEEFPDPPRSSE